MDRLLICVNLIARSPPGKAAFVQALLQLSDLP